MVKNLLACALLLGCFPLLSGCDAVAKGAKGAVNQATSRAINTANDAIATETRRQTEKVIEAGGAEAVNKITGSGEEEKKGEEDKEKKGEKSEKKEGEEK